MRSEWEEGMCRLSGGRVCGLSRGGGGGPR